MSICICFLCEDEKNKQINANIETGFKNRNKSKMSANDSGIENSNDSNDFALTFPAFKDFKDFSSPIELNTNSSTSSQQPHSMLSKFRQQSSGKMKMSKQNIKLASLPYFRARLNERKLRVAASISNVELLTKYLETGVNPNGMICSY